MKVILLISFIFSLALEASPRRRFPIGPDLSITPGDLCSTPSEFRYPEKIAYCKRDVNSWQKELTFINYRKIGYSLSGERHQYKIDHFIPLCLGGSNDLSNLWPQYYTVYEKTDLLEFYACIALEKGIISQSEVIDLVIAAKLNHTNIKSTLKRLKSLAR